MATRWGRNLLVTDQAKMSLQYRYVILNKVNSRLRELECLLVHALRYASPGAVLAVALSTPLPEQTDREELELYEKPENQDLSILINSHEDLREEARKADRRVATARVEWDVQSAAADDDHVALSAHKFRRALFDDSSSGSSSDDEWEENPNATHHSSGGWSDYQQFSEEASLFLSQTPHYPDDSTSTRWEDAFEFYRKDVAIESADARNTIFAPRKSSFAHWLQKYVDDLDAEREKLFLDDGMSGLLPQSSDKGAAVSGSDTRDFEDAYLNHIFDVSPFEHPVTILHISKLLTCIEQANQFYDYVTESIHTFLDARKTQEQRWDIAETHDLATCMKSRGLGSLLSHEITDEDEKGDN